MCNNPFTIGSNPPIVKGFTVRYAVSGEPLSDVETIQVLVRLPYCLYVPTWPYTFPHPRTSNPVGVVPTKIWTDKAEGSTIPTSDLIANGEEVYLSEPEFLTQPIGAVQQFTSGPKAINMEFDRDPTGYFRYTLLTVESDWKVPEGFDPYTQNTQNEEPTREIVLEISEQTLEIVNHFIDIYRVATEDVYTERIPYAVIEDIRIGTPSEWTIRERAPSTESEFTYKCGYHPNMLSTHGVRPAMVSKPKEIIDSFQAVLEKGVSPNADRLLHLSAQAALERRDSKLAVIESFLSLELYVEQFYYRKLSNTMGIPEIEALLTKENNWRLRTRLSGLLRTHFSLSISDMDNNLWEEWIKAFDQRNDLVHRNVVPSLEEA